MRKNKNDMFIAGFLYKEAVRIELEDRRKDSERHDFKIIDDMINDINSLGYALKYEADLRLREFHDRSLVPIYSKYYLRFRNVGRAEDLLSLIAKKGFCESTPLVIRLYEKIKTHESLHQIASCDNALVEIEDKSNLNIYLDYLRNEEDVVRLPLTMIMLAKWKIPEAKELFYRYLDSTNREVLFTAIEGLSYYDDPNGQLRRDISIHLDSIDQDIVIVAKSALKRLSKQKSVSDSQ